MSYQRAVSTAPVLAIVLLVVASVLAPVGIAAADAETEPNDDRDGAEAISQDESVTGQTTDGSNPDYFVFTAQSGQNITVTASADASGDTQFDLLDASGTVLSSTDNLAGESGRMGSTAPYTGRYYVRVSPYFDFTGANYSFTVTTAGTDEFEPNEDAGNATALTDEQEVTGTLTIGDADWFRFTAERGDRIDLSAFANDTGTTNVYLRHENGSIIDQSRDISGEQRRITATANYSGAYYVEVVPRYADFYGGSYNLTVDLPGSPTPTSAPETGSGETAAISSLPLLPVLSAIAVLLVLGAVWRLRSD